MGIRLCGGFKDYFSKIKFLCRVYKISAIMLPIAHMVIKRSLQNLILVITVSVPTLLLSEYCCRRFLPEISDTSIVQISDVNERYHHPLALSEPLAEPDPDSFRIIFLGDSFTHGICEPQYSFPHLLQEYFNNGSVAGIPNRRVQVFNLGSHSYSPTIYNIILSDYAPKLKPHLVIVAVDDSDPEDDFLYQDLVITDERGFPIAAYPRMPGVPQWLEHTGRKIKMVRLFCGVIDKCYSWFQVFNQWHLYGNTIGSFSERFNAEQLREKILRQGFDAFITDNSRGRKHLYLVKLTYFNAGVRLYCNTPNRFIFYSIEGVRQQWDTFLIFFNLATVFSKKKLIPDEYNLYGCNRIGHYLKSDIKRWHSALFHTIDLEDKIVDYCRSKNIDVALVNYPWPPAVLKNSFMVGSEFKEDRTYEPVFHRYQKDYASSKGVPYYDFTDYLRTLPEAEIGEAYLEKNEHFSLKGNMLFTQELVRFINPLIDKKK